MRYQKILDELETRLDRVLGSARDTRAGLIARYLDTWLELPLEVRDQSAGNRKLSPHFDSISDLAFLVGIAHYQLPRGKKDWCSDLSAGIVCAPLHPYQGFQQTQFLPEKPRFEDTLDISLRAIRALHERTRSALDKMPASAQTEHKEGIQKRISELREGETLLVPREHTDTGNVTLIRADGEWYPLQHVRGRGATEIYEILERLSEETGRAMISLADLKRQLGRDPEDIIRNHQKALRTRGFPKLLALTGGVVGAEPSLRFWHQITLSPEVSP